ncbi:MAG: hypothetical protein A2X04_08305 [Bacteroidetes bacterium GWF2_41_9]|nr:MAG: hypothetical protein A2X04_08305 [Bacteroidetes bacterium GWF2_41_9]HCU20227.1 hypothetical protein [Bacteroidales bacterium]
MAGSLSGIFNGITGLFYSLHNIKTRKVTSKIIFCKSYISQMNVLFIRDILIITFYCCNSFFYIFESYPASME